MNHNPLNHELDDELLSAYLDDELSVEERADVERRLAEDPAAQRLLDELRHVSQSVRGLPLQSLGHDLRDSVLRRVEDTKRMASGTSTESTSADAAIPSFSIGRSRRGWFWASLAVAAALVIMFLQRDEQPDDDLPPVARRDREPARLSAPRDAVEPDASPAASALATAREETESETMIARGEASAAGEAPGLAAGPGDNRFAISLEDQTADELTIEPTLVVHVLAKREALEQGAFDRLLLNCGIAVEPSAPPEPAAPPAAARTRSLGAVGRLAEQPVEPPAEESADTAADVDAVLVEAPRNVIFSCLTELSQDYANFLGVSVEDPAEHEPAMPAAQQKQKLADDLNQFNRGIVPQQQKALVTRDKSYYYSKQMPKIKLQPSFQGGAGGYADLSQQHPPMQTDDRSLDRRLEQRSSQGRAQRVQLAETDGGKFGAAREMRESKTFSGAADDNLQVLFVVGANNGQPTPAPAATAAPTTAQPE